MELARKSNNAFELQIKYSFVNLNLHVDRYRGIEVAHNLIVNKLNLSRQDT